MDHAIGTLRIDEHLLVGRSEGHHINTLLGEAQVVLALSQEDSVDLGLPKLEAFMAVESGPLLRIT